MPTANEQLAALRELIAAIGAGKSRDADLLIRLGGSLFDEHYLDGEQYHFIAELADAIEKNAGNIAELAERCVV